MQDAYWLVIDAPYVQLKLWPLKLGEDMGDKKTVSLSVDAWRLEVPRYSLVLGAKKCWGYIDLNPKCWGYHPTPFPRSLTISFWAGNGFGRPAER